MNSLLAALLNAGVVSEEKHNQFITQKSQQEELRSKQKQSQITRKSHTPVNLDQLDAANSVNAFRRAVLNILLADSAVIAQVIEKAHRFKDAKGGKKLIWQMFEVRDGLKNINPEDKEKFLRRALRRAGGTFEEVKK